MAPPIPSNNPCPHSLSILCFCNTLSTSDTSSTSNYISNIKFNKLASKHNYDHSNPDTTAINNPTNEPIISTERVKTIVDSILYDRHQHCWFNKHKENKLDIHQAFARAISWFNRESVNIIYFLTYQEGTKESILQALQKKSEHHYSSKTKYFKNFMNMLDEDFPGIKNYFKNNNQICTTANHFRN